MIQKTPIFDQEGIQFSRCAGPFSTFGLGMDGTHTHFTVRKAGSEYERRTKIAPIDIAGRLNGFFSKEIARVIQARGWIIAREGSTAMGEGLTHSHG